MKHRTGHLFKRGATYYLRYVVNGKVHQQALFHPDGKAITTKTDAVQAKIAIMAPFTVADEVTVLENVAAKLSGRKTELARLNDEVNPPTTLEQSWTAYHDSVDRPDSGERTLQEYESHYSQFLDWAKDHQPEVVAMRDVTRDMADAYAAHLLKRGLSTNRFNKHVRFLELLFRTLRSKARLTMNPWEEIRSKRLVPHSRRELTIEELRRVCEAATGEMRVLFGLGIYTGLRLGDCCTLRWGEVDLDRGIIRRVTNKTSRRNPKPVLVPIHPALSALLPEMPTDKPTEFVLPETAERYGRGVYMVTDFIQQHFANCGVKPYAPGTGPDSAEKDADGKRIAGTAKRAVVDVGFHSLRHTFVSLCRAANAPLSVVESIVGHSNPAMTRHYTHTGEAAAIAAVAAIPSVTGNTTAPAMPAPKPVDAGAIRTALNLMNAKNWKTVKADLLALVS
jgi:integrase